MIGRAGRYGLDTEADSYLCIAQSRVAQDKSKAMSFLKKEKCESIKSVFGRQEGVSRLILDSIAIDMVKSDSELKGFL